MFENFNIYTKLRIYFVTVTIFFSYRNIFFKTMFLTSVKAVHLRICD